MKTVARLLLACIASLWLATAAIAEEVIQLFDSRLVLSKDGGMEVTETITVLGEGRKIRRGIYRDFPIVFKDGSGRERKVQFDVVSVTRNGQPEDFHIKKANRATRLYIGNAKRLIGKGLFTYQITYRTDRQIRFFTPMTSCSGTSRAISGTSPSRAPGPNSSCPMARGLNRSSPIPAGLARVTTTPPQASAMAATSSPHRPPLRWPGAKV
jgi:hypothetical protein